VAGIIAIVIALCFAQCSSLLPRVGGPYAYARKAWGPFAGFSVGWALWLAEWISLAVFPIAFTRYLMFFLPSLDTMSQIAVKGLFVLFLIFTNIVGVKSAGRTNDALTLIKLLPLGLFILAGGIFVALNPAVAVSNYMPFSPFGFSNFGGALVLIFWAYAGFELSTIPADEIKDAGRTIPRAIILGIFIVIVFYLTTNLLLFGVRPWSTLANDTTPLISATANVLSAAPILAVVGGAIVGIGALFSIAGSDESGMLGTSRLGYALAIDGLFPGIFGKVHPRYKTPYLGIIIQGTTAFLASVLGDLGMLISTSVFLLAIAYVSTCASIFPLRRKSEKPEFRLRGETPIAILGVIFSIYLILQCTAIQIALGVVLLLIGVPIYIRYSPKKELTEIKAVMFSREQLWKKLMDEERFLAHLLRHLWQRIKKLY
jgi:amino acid transporter